MIIKNLTIAKDFSESERIIASFILSHGNEIKKMTIKELAKETYTSPATIIRLCRKVGVEGYREFRIKFNAEYEENACYEKEISENSPFRSDDSYEEVAINIANTTIKSIQETRRGFDYHIFDKIVKGILKCNEICIFGEGSSLLVAAEFKMKMLRLGWRIHMEESLSIQRSIAYNATEQTCAVIISHSGENPWIYNIVEILKKKKAYCVVITGDKSSSIAQKANYTICTGSMEEKSFGNKLENFTSPSSTHYILDCMYCFIYLSDYEENKDKNIIRAKENEQYDVLRQEKKRL